VEPPNVPAAHDSHVVWLEAPVAAENVPVAQRVQEVALDAPAVTEYRPVVQAMQVEEVDQQIIVFLVVLKEQVEQVVVEMLLDLVLEDQEQLTPVEVVDQV